MERSSLELPWAKIERNVFGSGLMDLMGLWFVHVGLYLGYGIMGMGCLSEFLGPKVIVGEKCFSWWVGFDRMRWGRCGVCPGCLGRGDRWSHQSWQLRSLCTCWLHMGSKIVTDACVMTFGLGIVYMMLPVPIIVAIHGFNIYWYNIT